MEERWADVVGFEEYFMVSDHGRIYSKRTDKILVTGVSKAGYRVLSTRIGGRKGKCYCLRVHRLVAEAFLDKPSDELVEEMKRLHYKIVPVNHKDGVKTNNHYTNLEWCSYSDNTKHCYNKLGHTAYKGEENPSSKVTDDIVRDIRENLVPNCKKNGFRAFARKYGINKETVRGLYYRKHWKHVK